MALLQVRGWDPSLRHWGIAHGTYDTETNKLDITHVEVVEPVIPKGKQVRVSNKDLTASEQLAAAAVKSAKGAHAIFVEVPHGSQSARAMAGYGICLGVLGTLRAGGIQFYELTERELKLATLGKPSGTKEEAIDWATARFAYAPWSTKTEKGITSWVASKVEHQADAAAAIYAGVHSKDFLQMLQITHNPN